MAIYQHLNSSCVKLVNYNILKLRCGYYCVFQVWIGWGWLNLVFIEYNARLCGRIPIPFRCKLPNDVVFKRCRDVHMKIAKLD